MKKQTKNTPKTQIVDSEKIYAPKSAKVLTLITCIVIAAVIAFNVVFSIIGDKAMLYIDISRIQYDTGTTNLYTLSDYCKDVIENRAVSKIYGFNEQSGEDQKVKIIFCADRDVVESNEMTRYVSYTARAIAKSFPEYFEVSYINIVKNPSAVQKYKTTSAATINNSDVIVEFGSEYLVQGINSFYLTDTDTDEIWAYNGEKRLAAMILSVTAAETPICCLTYNHGELLFEGGDEVKVKEEYSTFIKLIEGAGYEVQFIDFERDEIPEDCRMLITFAPTEDFKAFGNLGENGVSEIEKLDKYLDESNAFFYICDADTPVLSSLDEYLEEWGIVVKRSEDLAGNTHNFRVEDIINATTVDNGKTFVGNYAVGGTGASLTQDMRGRNYPPNVIFGNSAIIEPNAETYVKLYSKVEEGSSEPSYQYFSYFRNGISREMFSVFTSYDTASAYAGSEVEIATASNLFQLMTVTHELRYVQEDNYTTIDQPTYVISLASTEFLTNNVLDSTAYGNTDVVLSVLRNTGNEIVPVNVPLKAFYEYNVQSNTAYTQSNPTVWFWCLAVIPPVAALIGCVVVTVRRKYK